MSQFARTHPSEPPVQRISGESDSAIRDEAESERYCGCDLELTLEEIDRGKCAACGKEIL